MERNIRMEEISDGKRYCANDMVRADSAGCEGCFACCCGMGTSVVLDPLDIHRLCAALHCDMQALLASGGVALNVQEGLILPNLRMDGAGERCGFLNASGRCSVHAARPGICRLFPLGRIYEDGTFQYFLQTHECKKENRAKVRIKKWLDTPLLSDYERFVSAWHYFLKGISARIKTGEISNEELRTLNMQLLQLFYLNAYPMETEDCQSEHFYETFYPAFYRRLAAAKEALQL